MPEQQKVSYQQLAPKIRDAVFLGAEPPEGFQRHEVPRGRASKPLRALLGPHGVVFIEQNPSPFNHGGRRIVNYDLAQKHHILWGWKVTPGGYEYWTVDGKAVGIVDGAWTNDMNTKLKEIRDAS